MVQVNKADQAVNRIAIVGGGCAGIATALELSSANNPVPVDITIYQMGWRLGGKGASGRGVNDRIEEHGLHLWLGFYENAFRIMRECYAELDRDPNRCPIATFNDAFIRDSQVSVAESNLDGSWDIWRANFPETTDEPGLNKPGDSPFSFGRYMSMTLSLAVSLLSSVMPDSKEKGGRGDGLEAQLKTLLGLPQLAGAQAILEIASVTQQLLQATPQALFNADVSQAIERLQDMAASHIRTVTLTDDNARRIWTILDLIFACLKGVYRFDLYRHPHGFDAINEYDWLEWLQLNGATEETIDSAFVRGSCYDLTFAYRDGDPSKHAFAAGVALRCALRMFFTYRGAIFWKMTAGMGDIVFAPAYEVLRRRGVKFKFFHKLSHVSVAKDSKGQHVNALRMERQADITGEQYEPLVNIKGLPCWPSQPLYDQFLGEGGFPSATELESQDGPSSTPVLLEVNKDFDMVVLAVSIDTIKDVCTELIDASPAWRDMTKHVTSVATQAAQIWMKPDMTDLGVKGPPGNLSGFVTPFDTWADMSVLIEKESWDEETPKSLAYFCSALSEEQARRVLEAGVENKQAALEALVESNLGSFLNHEIQHLWPNAKNPCDYLTRNNHTFVSANYFGSDRYVQSLPGTIRHRISPLDRTFDNLTIAGDWTRNGIDAGCVEAAVMSGLLASHAISEYPALHDIIGLNHP